MNGSMAQYEIRELNPWEDSRIVWKADGYIPPLFMEDGGTSPSKKNTYHIPMPPTTEAQTNGGSAWGGVAAALAPEQGYDGSLYGDVYTVPLSFGNFSADPYDRSREWSISLGALGDPTQGPYDHLDDRIRRDDDGPPGWGFRFFRIESGF